METSVSVYKGGAERNRGSKIKKACDGYVRTDFESKDSAAGYMM